MATLPAATDFTGASITEAQFKTAITGLRGFLADLLGSDGTVSTALATLGALGSGTVAKSANYTVVAADRGKLIDCTSTITLSLTAAAAIADGFSIAVRNSGTGTITIDPNGSEQVDGASTMQLYSGESCVIVCNGSAWKTLGKASGVIAGTVCHYAASTAPSGWLKCDGSAISRTTYASLFAAIGTVYGSGDGSTTFNLPEIRGEAIRGWDDGRGVDSGRVFGSAQAGGNAAHTHAVLTYHTGTVPAGSGATLGVRSIMTESVDSNMTTPAGWGADGSGLVMLDSQGSESRMRNIALLAIIKF